MSDGDIVTDNKETNSIQGIPVGYVLGGSDKGYEIVLYYPKHISMNLKNYMMVSLIKEMRCICQ